MQFLIITSTEDIASMNMRDKFLKLFQFKQVEPKWHDNPLFKLESYSSKVGKSEYSSKSEIYLGLTNSPLVHLNDLRLFETGIDPDLLIFASRHRSETARPAFLIHSTGNWWSKAEFGGNPKELSRTSALLIKAGLLSLIAHASRSTLKQFSIDLEVSHHGPTLLEKPLVFMELGSSEHEWNMEEAGVTVASAIIETIFKYSEFQEKKLQQIGVGFGGTHYAPQFQKLIIEKEIAISYICPKYFIKDLDKEMIEQMLKKNYEKVDYFVIDWKGVNSEEKSHLVTILETFNIPIKKTKDL